MRVSILLLGLFVVSLMIHNYFQQKAIDALINTQSIQAAWFADVSKQLAELQRIDESQVLILEDHENRLLFTERQCDVLVAASRSGKNGFKVIAAYEETTK